ncbi:MAG: DUF2934 domain-containing protein [Cellvibrio sp.]|uniref:DUF2934 domain-containing protein n=1 Tax=Cellvibrio sp. TaxID=1965322 RepID=UPI002726EA14|nr:DUF2934 domain-containing protein [Cellvibrio sp.]
MRLSTLLLKSSVALGLLLIGRSIFSRPILTPTEALRKIDIHSYAAIKSAQLALEKSSSSLLREIAQNLLNDLKQENEQLRKISMTDESYSSGIQFEAEKFRFNYDYNEESPFDLAYTSHQLNECNKIVELLQRAVHMQGSNLKDIALRNLSIFLRHQADLATFKENFLSVNEYRIRDLAYQIWEVEGRPEGEEKRHWRLATELMKDISPADLQLAFEQKRSLIDSLSTTPIPVANKNLH